MPRFTVAEFVEDVNLSDAFRRQAEDHLPRVRVHARNAHRQARNVGFILLLAFVPELLRPRQERQLTGLQPAFAFDVGIRATAKPRSAEIRMPIGQTWHGTVHLAVGNEWSPAGRDARDAILRMRLDEQRVCKTNDRC